MGSISPICLEVWVGWGQQWLRPRCHRPQHTHLSMFSSMYSSNLWWVAGSVGMQRRRCRTGCQRVGLLHPATCRDSSSSWAHMTRLRLPQAAGALGVPRSSRWGFPCSAISEQVRFPQFRSSSRWDSPCSATSEQQGGFFPFSQRWVLQGRSACHMI